MAFQASERLSGIQKTILRQINDSARPDAINLGLGEPDFKTPEPIDRHAAEFILGKKFGYTVNAGLPALRKLIAKDSGLDVDEECVCVMNGAEEALFCAVMAVVNPGDEVLIGNPAFLAYAPMVKIAGGTPVEFDLQFENNFCVRSADIENKLSPKTKLIMLNSPANPTGAVDTEVELKKIAALVEGRSCYVISDEVYSRIWYDQEPVSIGKFSEKAITISSLSKTFAMTGWRLGWTIARPEITAHLVALHQHISTCASTISQEAAIHALQGHAEADVRRMTEAYRARREIMMNAVKKYTDLGFVRPQGAFYMLLNVRSKEQRFGNSLAIAKKILEAVNVVTIPGSVFGSNAEGYLRLSFAASPENIEEGMRRIGKFFQM